MKALAIALLVSPGAFAGISDCSGTYAHDCCRVVQLWKHFGKSTSVSWKNKKECCKKGLAKRCYSDYRVKVIDWGNKGLSGSIPSWINKLSKLQKLILDGNRITGSIRSEIGSLSLLTNLRLLDNRMSGTIPSSLGNLTRLKRLNLGKNADLSGSVPSSLSNLTKLERITLQDTKLSGSVTSIFRNMGRLESIRVSDTNLKGAVYVRDGAEVIADNSDVVACGKAAGRSPFARVDNTVPIACLAYSGGSLRKRATVLTRSYSGYTFQCDKNGSGHPYQNCANMIAYVCKYQSQSTCRSVMDSIFAKLNSYSANMHKYCARWKRSRNSSSCSSAKSRALSKVKFNTKEGVINLPPVVVDLLQNLWSNM